MSVCVRNIELFLKNHPSLFTKEQKQQILATAKNIAELNGGLIVSARIKEIFTEPTAAMFFQELSNLEHIQIFSEENFKSNH